MCVCVIIPCAVRRPIVWEAIKGNFPEFLVEAHARLNSRAVFWDRVDSFYISFSLLFDVSVFLSPLVSSARLAAAHFVVKRLVFASVFISISAPRVWRIPL